MPRKRKNKMKHVRLRRGKKKSNDMSMFREMQFYINNNNTEDERLIELLNRCSNEVLQHTGITGGYLLNYKCKRTRFKTLLLLMYEFYPYATEQQVYWPIYYPMPIGIGKRLHDIISTLIIGVAFLIEKLIEKLHGYVETALFQACDNNQVELVKLLLRHNFTDTNRQDGFGMTAFHKCCRILDNELIMLFLKNDDVDFEVKETIQNYTAFDIYFATTSNVRDESYGPSCHDILVEFAKKYSSIMNKDNERSSNMLHSHVKEHWEDFHAFDYLLNNGYADVMINQKDHHGNTPFHYACYTYGWSTVDHYKKLLLRSGLLLNARNDKGRTPFHFACFSLNCYMIEDLIANPSVNVNEIDNQGENGLHCMIQCFILNYPVQYMNCVHILLEKNPFLVIMKNNSGETPIDYAVKFHSSGPDDRYVWLNGKRRRLPCNRMNEIWSTLVTVLQDYHTEAKNLMYKYFMETFTNHIS